MRNWNFDKLKLHELKRFRKVDIKYKKQNL